LSAALHEDGLRGQAAAVARTAVWALAQKDVERLCFLAPWQDGTDVGMGHRPALCTLNLVSGLLDGKPYRGELDMGRKTGDVVAVVFGDGPDQTAVLWSKGFGQRVAIACQADKVQQLDVIGRPVPLIEKSGDVVIVSVTPEPIFLTGGPFGGAER